MIYYENFSEDMLAGGQGDDLLNGGHGDDELHGGGYGLDGEWL